MEYDATGASKGDTAFQGSSYYVTENVFNNIYFNDSFPPWISAPCGRHYHTDIINKLEKYWRQSRESGIHPFKLSNRGQALYCYPYDPRFLSVQGEYLQSHFSPWTDWGDAMASRVFSINRKRASHHTSSQNWRCRAVWCLLTGGLNKLPRLRPNHLVSVGLLLQEAWHLPVSLCHRFHCLNSLISLTFCLVLAGNLFSKWKSVFFQINKGKMSVLHTRINEENWLKLHF